MLFVLIAAAVGSAPLTTFAHAQQLMKLELRDPASATFRNMRIGNKIKGGRAICGEVNSRNGYGGMAGYVRFFAGKDKAFMDGGEKEEQDMFDMYYTLACGSGKLPGAEP